MCSNYIRCITRLCKEADLLSNWSTAQDLCTHTVKYKVQMKMHISLILNFISPLDFAK
jgi:hypothetical protein